MVIVNKNPHFKKVPLLILQFPSPPTWNNWLSHLLNLYSFVIYLYSSSNHFFVSSHLLLPSPFFFFFPLTRPHEAEEWQPLPISACFDGCFNQNRPYQPILLAISIGIDRIGMFRWPYRFPFSPKSARIGPFWPESTWIWPSQCELARIKKKKRESWWVGRQTPNATLGRVGLRYGDLGAASVLTRLRSMPNPILHQGQWPLHSHHRYVPALD